MSVEKPLLLNSKESHLKSKTNKFYLGINELKINIDKENLIGYPGGRR